MRRLLLVLVAALVTDAGAAELDVRVVAGRVQVNAVATPVSQILDRLAQQTGMRVIYDGVPPRALVSVTLHDVTPAVAVLDVLQGLGLNYALMLDPGGTRVQTLMMVASSPAGGAGGTGAAVRPPPPVTPAAPLPTPPPEAPEAEQDEEEGEEAPEKRRPDQPIGTRRPGGPPVPGVPPAQLPQGPTFLPGQPFTVVPMPLQPSPAPSPTPPQS